MDIKSMNFKENFNKTSKEIAEDRKMIRESILQVIQTHNNSELEKNRLQRIKSELGNYGLTTENIDDEKMIIDTLKKDILLDSNMFKLHSSLFYSDNNITKKIQDTVYADKDLIKEILKIDLYGIIERKIFLFHDIPSALSDRDIQKVLREIDEETLAKALLGEPFFVKDKFLKNMSNRMQHIMKNQMKKYSSSTDAKETYENQIKIIKIINQMVEDTVIIPEGKFSDIERLCY